MPTRRRSKQRPTSPLRSSQVNPESKEAVEALMVTNMGEILASNLRASRSKVANPSMSIFFTYSSLSSLKLSGICLC